jgi:hypothetical protein
VAVFIILFRIGDGSFKIFSWHYSHDPTTTTISNWFYYTGLAWPSIPKTIVASGPLWDVDTGFVKNIFLDPLILAYFL